MEVNNTLIPAGEALAEIGTLLDRIDPDRSRLDGATRLAWLRAARKLRGRIDSFTAILTAEADHAKAAENAAGTPLVSWLGMGETMSRREAAGAVRQARALGQHPLVGEAAMAGRLGTTQAKAITGVLDGLAPQLDVAQQRKAEELLIDLAGHLDADQLSSAADRVLKAVVPAEANELLEQRLQRQAEAAHRQRSLRFFYEGASVRFDGSLPRLAAEQWIAQLDARQEQLRRTAIERRDPLAESLTPEQRRADALIALISQSGSAPAGRRFPDNDTRGKGIGQTGDAAGRTPPPTARVLVKLDYHELQARAAGAGALPDGHQLSAGELRRVCCDAEIVPIVLGAASEVLDVGRAERLVTPGMRAALVARDGGCVFPGCDAPPARCEAHHLIPWWAGGATALHNLVLLCHSHHPVVEPAKYPIRDQWQVRIAGDGPPEFTPPKRLDPEQRPIRHARHSSADGHAPPARAPGVRPLGQTRDSGPPAA